MLDNLFLIGGFVGIFIYFIFSGITIMNADFGPLISLVLSLIVLACAWLLLTF